MTAVVAAGTIRVAAGKFTVVAPAGTAMLPGTVTSGLLLARETMAPPAGAGRLKVTVPRAVRPSLIVVGNSSTEPGAGGV